MKRSHAILVCLVVASPVLAGDGAIPIWEPKTTITQSGKYIVTRNIATPPNSGPTILIANGVDTVDIDLNGQALFGDPNLNEQGIIEAQQVANITIRNGVIWGRGAGPEAGVYVNEASRVVVEEITTRNTAGPGIIVENVGVAHLRRNAILNAASEAIQFRGSPAGAQITGEVEDNAVWNSHWGIWVTNASSVGIRNNRISQVDSFGIRVEDCLGCLLVDNTVQQVGDGNGIDLRTSEGCEIRGNSVMNAFQYGIVITSDTNLIVDNTVKRSGLDGLRIEGLENHIERNLLVFNGQSGSGWGLHFVGSVFFNTYGRNTARSNPGPMASCPSGAPPTKPATNDFCDEGSGNSSFNDNYMPSLF